MQPKLRPLQWARNVAHHPRGWHLVHALYPQRWLSVPARCREVGLAGATCRPQYSPTYSPGTTRSTCPFP